VYFDPMTFTRYVLGGVFGLWALYGLFSLAVLLIGGEYPKGQFAVSVWGGKIAGVTIPAVLTLLMFRRKGNRQS
jgi:hypothetical protein